MTRRLFDDLVVSATGTSRSRSFRTWPLSLALHGLAVAVVAALSVSAVTERPTRTSPVVFASSTRPGPKAVPATVKTGPSRAPRSQQRPLVVADSLPPVVADAPPPAVVLRSSDGPVGDSPVCLSGCTPGDPAGGDTPGTRGGGGTDDGPAPLRPVGGDIQEPRRIHGTAPGYPELARRAHVEGKVVLECVIDVDGRVTDLRVMSGHPLLAEAALDAVRRWVYTPTRLNGRAIRVILNVTVKFGLHRD
jgi:periplasmic protein TonB